MRTVFSRERERSLSSLHSSCLSPTASIVPFKMAGGPKPYQNNPNGQALPIPQVLNHHSTIGTHPVQVLDSSSASSSSISRRSVPEAVILHHLPSVTSRPRALARAHSIYRSDQSKFQENQIQSELNQDPRIALRQKEIDRLEKETEWREVIQVELGNKRIGEEELNAEIQRRIKAQEEEEEMHMQFDGGHGLVKRKGPLSVENR